MNALHMEIMGVVLKYGAVISQYGCFHGNLNFNMPSKRDIPIHTFVSIISLSYAIISCKLSIGSFHDFVSSILI